MDSSALLTLTCGLGSAMAWGAADFSGGLASRKASALFVVFISKLTSCLLFAAMTLSFPEKLTGPGPVIMGVAAGMCGAMGVGLLYYSLANGPMGVAAPVSALVNVAAPIFFSFFTQGLPGPLRLAGLGIGTVSIWIFSSRPMEKKVRAVQVIFPAMAGLCFGLFFILIDAATETVFFLPLFAARIGSSMSAGIYLAFKGRPAPPAGAWLWFALLIGLLDALGAVSFALAAKSGTLDIVAFLASLYPAFTLFLAWIALKERLDKRQWAGVVAAILALMLVSV